MPSLPSSICPSVPPWSLPASWRWESEIRSYRVDLYADLCGGFCLLRLWRGKFNRRGGQKQHTFLSFRQAYECLRWIHQRSLRRGYALVAGHDLDALPAISTKPSMGVGRPTIEGIQTVERLRKTRARPRVSAQFSPEPQAASQGDLFAALRS
jgi:hypothetical protein